MDTFVAEIIKALPDAIATAIVTVLLTGGILFVFHKKIEELFARSLFVYQTKFSINHAKSVETLETLYKKFMIFNNAVEELISAKRFAETEIEDGEWNKKAVNADDLLKNFWNYYKENHLFLPAAMADNIPELYGRTGRVSLMIALALSKAKSDEGHNLKWEGGPMSIDKKRYDDIETLLEDMVKELYKQSTYLEALYKSVAEAQ